MHEKARCDEQRAFLFFLALCGGRAREGVNIASPAAIRTMPSSPHASGGDPGLCRLRRRCNGFDAAGRAAAGYFLLLAQEKVTKEKGNPEPPKPPALLASTGREPNSPSAKSRARLRHRLATSPGRGSDARRRLRVPTSTATPVTEKRG